MIKIALGESKTLSYKANLVTPIEEYITIKEIPPIRFSEKNIEEVIICNLRHPLLIKYLKCHL